MSNFCCLPGRAGGPPLGVRRRFLRGYRELRERIADGITLRDSPGQVAEHRYVGVNPMSKQLVVTETSRIPASIKRLWGPPPILPSEDVETYWKFALAMAHSV